MAGPVIDLRDDPYRQAAEARSIGSDIGAVFGYRQRERQRQEAQAGIIRILQRKASDENYTDEQALADLAGVRGLAEAAAKQWLANSSDSLDDEYKRARIEATDALTKQREGAGGDLGTFTKYQNIYNSAAKQRNELLTIAKATKTEPDPKVTKQLEAQMEYGRRGMAQFTSKSEPQTSAFDKYGFVKPKTQPSGFINPYADTFAGGTPMAGQSQQQTKADEAIAKEIAPSAPPGLAEIWDELDAESKQAAMELLAKGVAPEQLIAHYKKKMTGK